MSRCNLKRITTSYKRLRHAYILDNFQINRKDEYFSFPIYLIHVKSKHLQFLPILFFGGGLKVELLLFESQITSVAVICTYIVLDKVYNCLGYVCAGHSDHRL